MKQLFLKSNGLQLAYDEFGSAGDPALVLVMGLGSQMVHWPDDFCAALATIGLRVIRFDNRDIGLSEKIAVEQEPALLKLTLYKALG